MPKKIRELKSLLLQAGFGYKPGKGSHSKWIHPQLPKAIYHRWQRWVVMPNCISEKQVNEALEELKKMEEEETEE
jgi:predicted RNA binding protein YcfA (HicA-like mRNA interferase family)